MAIDSYEFGKVVIDGKEYTSDVIVWPDGVDDSWWREEGHSLCRKDMKPVLDKMPSVLVIGTGMNGRMKVPADLIPWLSDHCSEVHVEETSRACEIYNHAEKQGHHVVGALHLTC
jgi:hypothetical protein